MTNASQTEFRRLNRIAAAVSVAIAALASPAVQHLGALAGHAQFSARVVDVADGDTLTVLRDKQQLKVRLQGVDCPEGGQAFGAAASPPTWCSGRR